MKSDAIRYLTLFILLLAVTSLCLTSCNRSYDETEVLTNAEELLRRTEMLNSVYYGKGIGTRSAGEANGAYREADPYHLHLLGFSTIEELKGITEDTFTVSYSNRLFNTVLSSLADEDNIYQLARYYQSYDGEKLDEPVCIMVYENYTSIFDDRLEYDYSSLAVSRVKKDRVYVTVNATVENEEGESQTVEIEFALLEENEGWRIDSPTFANYSDGEDLYEDLENKDI